LEYPKRARLSEGDEPEMSYETFTWAPRISLQGTVTLRVRSAQFGDGYSQDAADGINSSVRSYPLTFIGYKEKIDAIEGFFERHGGWKRFSWTPPHGKEGLYKVKAYTPGAEGGGVYTISATFEQAFAP
jgi:phage-related protein